MIVDFGEHALDIDFRLVEGADGSHTCECGAELLKNRRFGIGFEAFHFTSSRDVETGYVDAEG